MGSELPELTTLASSAHGSGSLGGIVAVVKGEGERKVVVLKKL